MRGELACDQPFIAETAPFTSTIHLRTGTFRVDKRVQNACSADSPTVTARRWGGCLQAPALCNCPLSPPQDRRSSQEDAAR